ncbi:MAG: hypothetical protein AB8B73_14500 [Ekhidna sp.]
MKNRIVLAFLIAFLLTSQARLFAQDLKEQSYKAYIASDLNQWKTIVENKTIRPEVGDNSESFELALSHYGLVALSLYTGNDDLFDDYVPLTHDLLDQLIDEDEGWAEPLAVSSFIMGFQISDSPMKGVYLGPKSLGRMSDALELDDQSPVVMQLYAGSKYFAPKIFGGDVNEAIQNYLIAIDLFESTNRTDEWMYLDALAFLGKSYMRTGQTRKAIVVYQKALAVEPEFNWVKMQLLPEAQQSISITE